MLTNEQVINMAPAAGALAPINGVSDKYSFVPTMEAVDLLREVGWKPVSADQSLTRVAANEGFQRHMIRFSQNGNLDLGEERVDLVLYNSHDRGCAFRLIASIWRKICGNGLMVSSKLANFSHKHIGFSDRAFVESANKIGNQAGTIAQQVDTMRQIQLEPKERELYAAGAHSLIYPKGNPIEPAKLLKERRYDDNGKDLWTTFNVVQENGMKGGLKTDIRKESGKIGVRTTRPVKALDRDVKLNQALWTLTEKMAELKAA